MWGKLKRNFIEIARYYNMFQATNYNVTSVLQSGQTTRVHAVCGNGATANKNYRTLLRLPGQMDACVVLFAIVGRTFGMKRQLEAPGTFINTISHDN